MKLEEGSDVRIGLDDFALRVLGPIGPHPESADGQGAACQPGRLRHRPGHARRQGSRSAGRGGHRCQPPAGRPEEASPARTLMRKDGF
ncbi:MAG: hypothetical protein MZV70_61340 [Desulfobacterales bacterium]|nr:hypothetical protein [Desulfobacterales bacterium]